MSELTLHTTTVEDPEMEVVEEGKEEHFAGKKEEWTRKLEESKKEIEILSEEYENKEYIVPNGETKFSINLENFITKHIPWKGTEAVGIMEFMEILKRIDHEAEEIPFKSKELIALHIFLHRYEATGANLASMFMSIYRPLMGVYQEIADTQRKFKLALAKQDTYEHFLSALEQGVLPVKDDLDKLEREVISNTMRQYDNN